MQVPQLQLQKPEKVICNLMLLNKQVPDDSEVHTLYKKEADRKCVGEKMV